MNWKADLLVRLAAPALALLVGGVTALACAEGDWQVLQAAWQETPWKRSFITSMEILAALITATGLAALLRPLFQGRLILAGFLFSKAAIFFPVSWLAWSFIGGWTGRLGFPLWTLMPATGLEGTPWDWSLWLWTWVPVVAVLIVPLTGQCLSLSLEKETSSREMGHLMLGVLALLLVIPVEDIFGVEGAGLTLARTLRQPGSPLTDATALWTLTGTAMQLAVCLFFPRHVLLPRWRSGRAWSQWILALLLKLSAWLTVIGLVIRDVSGGYRQGFSSQELELTLNHPLAALYSGLPWMLCALSLWMLGHIIQPRQQTSSPLS